MSGESAYFVDHKRGEVNELKALLRSPKISKDVKRKREVIKKVIAYMTLGIDMSKLFSELMMCSVTRDLVQKKMVYLYLTTYATKNPELSLLAVNTLQRDCRDDDPMVRGLALRSLCSMRLPNLIEYIEGPVKQGLSDSSAYVRKTAVQGVAKMYAISPETVRDSDPSLIDVLYNMLRDKDPAVVQNAIRSLNETLRDEGGMAINKQIALHLLNQLGRFSEWGQVTVLELLRDYRPTGPTAKQDTFGLMNLLESRLKHCNSAVVLSAIRMCLNLTEKMPNVHREVYKRIKPPLLTLMCNPVIEVAYPVLSHVHAVATRQPDIFNEDYKQFYCRHNDPYYFKEIKLKILLEIANEANAYDIVNELAEYVTDEVEDIARMAIRYVGRMGLKVPAIADASVEHLLMFLGFSMDYVLAETCATIKDLLRKYPERADAILPVLKRYMGRVDDPQGKRAVFWMIGEYGEKIEDAPYTLENFIDDLCDGEDDSPSEVRNELLTAAMKLFFKRPPEMQKMLGRLLKYTIGDMSRMDVRDRAMLYYRLLQHNVAEARRVVCSEKVVVDVAATGYVGLSDQIFNEFNSLSIVYRQPATMFCNLEEDLSDDEDEEDEEEEGRTPGRAAAKPHPPPKQAQSSSQPVNLLDMGAVTAAVPVSAPTQPSGGVDLLADIMGSSQTPSQPSQPSLQLNPNPQVNPAEFQKLWGTLPSGPVGTQAYNVAQGMEIEGRLTAKSFRKIASGLRGNTLTLYAAAQAADGTFIFVELLGDQAAGQLKITVKAGSSGGGNAEVAAQATQLVKHVLAGIL